MLDCVTKVINLNSDLKYEISCLGREFTFCALRIFLQILLIVSGRDYFVLISWSIK